MPLAAYCCSAGVDRPGGLEKILGSKTSRLNSGFAGIIAWNPFVLPGAPDLSTPIAISLLPICLALAVLSSVSADLIVSPSMLHRKGKAPDNS
jgi:hypothetical protein